MTPAGVALFLVVVGGVASGAAILAERGLRDVGLATRWPWVAALWSGPLLLAWAMWAPTRSPDAALGWAPVIPLPALTVTIGDAPLIALDVALGVLWGVSSLVALLVLAIQARRLAGLRASWNRTRVLDADVFVSAEDGPAVSGLLTPRIVLPRWALALPPTELGLVLLHEHEHVRAGDTRVVALGLLAVLVTPWNPLAWWQLRRLRCALEIDCDRRVLRRRPDEGAYGRCLLAVADHGIRPNLALAAFIGRPLSLERRIRAMTETRSRWTPLKGALLLAAALAVGVQACSITPPDDDAPAAATAVADDPTAGDAAVRADATGDAGELGEAESGELERRRREQVEQREADRVLEDDEGRRGEPAGGDEGPAARPYTAAPAILNRSEVVAAMEAEYPPLLRDAGIGGTIVVTFFVDKDGVVRERRIRESSGHMPLDEAALAVADVYRFSAALDGDDPVDVWVTIPITYNVR